MKSRIWILILIFFASFQFELKADNEIDIGKHISLKILEMSNKND